MKYEIIKTGSQGNAVVLNDVILIDCGVPFKALKDHTRKLKAVLFTHEHTDHLNKATVKRLHKGRPTLRFACCSWLAGKLLDCGVSKRVIDVLDVGVLHDYTLFQVMPVALTHNVSNCGYRIFMNGKKMFYATDCGNLDGITAPDYDLYFIEANYTDEEMAERIAKKEAEGVFTYEYEVVNNHLSKAQADEFIYSNIKQGQYVYLHQHI